jgi:hypothetical protein
MGAATSAVAGHIKAIGRPQADRDIRSHGVPPMDQLLASPFAGVDPAIAEILDRTRRLTGDDLVALARAYAEAADSAPADDGIDRSRALVVARIRAVDRAVHLRELEKAAAAAVRTVGMSRTPLTMVTLRRIGVLGLAERAVADAVLSIALHDRLGPDVAAALRAPWDTVA